MDFKQLQKEFRKLEKDAGEDTASALIAIMEFRATQFEEKLDQFKVDVDRRFSSIDRRFNSIQWMMGIGFSAIALMIAMLKLF